MQLPTTTAEAPANPVAPAPAPLPDLSMLNGQHGASPVPSRLPRPAGWSMRAKVLAIAGLLAVVAGASATYYFIRGPFQRARTDLVTHRVHRERLELNIVERGALESARNSDVDELVSWALPIQERHLQDVLRGSQKLAAE